MLRKIRHKGLVDLFENGTTRRIDKRFHNKLIDLLDMLDGATEPEDLAAAPDFHPLKGNRKGSYSIHVTGNYVLTFRFEDQDVTDLNYEDYH
ncbi:HigB toxin protein [Caenispirillum salinarum AK4]|uniref:HigB toxin protein n=1 Tax=Caenispirillum salinarum AK4 TaxID=1238182 RepID=K9HNY5_9PROT|nr:type II toxin-antitoxin system RelE/ParE family toxin [Caenispirillum salinarum]EKV30156.1 HigB toxin protein [Caenispirillum salinarum AK4]